MAKESESLYYYEKAIEIPIYRGYLIVVFTNDIDTIKKAYPAFVGKNVYAHTIYINHKDSQGFCVIFNFKNKNRRIYHGVIAHESLHAANMIAEERGILLSTDNDEPMAYLTEFITDEIYKYMERCGFKAHINK